VRLFFRNEAQRRDDYILVCCYAVEATPSGKITETRNDGRGEYSISIKPNE
jgi:hypothetical protein